MWLLPLLLSCVLVPTPAMGDGAVAALQRWKESVRHDDLRECDVALAELGRFDDVLMVKAFVRYLPDSDIAFRPAIRHELARVRNRASVDELRDAILEAEHPIAREQLALMLTEGCESASSWADLIVPWLSDEHAPVRASTVYALGRLQHLEALDAVIAALDDSSPIVRRRVPEALVALAGERSRSLVIECLSDARWQVRVAAARALRELPSRATTEALLDRLAKESGRVREDILDSLESITGRAYGLDLGAWRRWLAVVNYDFSARFPERVSTAAEKPRGGSAVAGASSDYLRSAPSYFGITTLSDQLMLVTDVSTSMDADMLPAAALPTTSRFTRLDAVRVEVVNLLSRLNEATRFNFVVFSDSARLWSIRMVLADDVGLRRARHEVSDWHPTGFTNVYGTLSLVFDIAQRESEGGGSSDKIAPDTVFILSDGEPTAGRLRDTELLIAYFAERNRHLDLRFHGIALYGGDELLKGLAAQCGGEYVQPTF